MFSLLWQCQVDEWQAFSLCLQTLCHRHLSHLGLRRKGSQGVYSAHYVRKIGGTKCKFLK